MQKYLSISIASILALSAPGIAKASPLTVTSAIGGVPTVSGATLENFNEPTPPILTLSGAAYLLTGADFVVAYVPPYFSGSTAAFFGESPATGLDSSQYVAVEVGGSATLSFSTPQNYLGLLWGTIDAGNSLTFYDSANNAIGTVIGTDVPTMIIDGWWNPNTTSYVNITSATAFSRVVASTSQNSFEFDDVAYAQVPEPASTVLFSAGLCLLGFGLRRKSA
jgi:hypothetical protein